MQMIPVILLKRISQLGHFLLQMAVYIRQAY